MRRSFLPLMLLVACGGDSDHPAQGLPTAGKDGDTTNPFEFLDATESSGLDFVHDAGMTEDKHLPETMGAGAALADFNEDGHLDLYLVQSGALPLGPARDGVDGNQLWLGDGRGGFENVTSKSGDGADRGYGMGVACGDYDGDGHLDLYLTNLGRDILLKGDGRGAFRDVTKTCGIVETRWTAGSTWFDADADGDLDLFVTAYVDYDLNSPEHCGDRRPGYRSYCHPDRFQGIQDRFWRNRGDGTFEDATVSAGFTDSFGKGLGVCASDFDGDGDLDLYVANDSVENRLWINSGTGHFTDGTLLAGTGVNGMGLTEAGMGIATGDFDGDGRIDLYVTNFDDESNTLYRNDGDGLFTDVTSSVGLEAPSRLPVGFGVVAADFDEDGDLDIAVANGHIIDNIHLYNDGKSWAQHALLFANDGKGHFRDVSRESGDLAKEARVGRGLYAGDLDEDGDLDLVFTENNGPTRVLLKAGAGARSVELWGLPPGTRVEFVQKSGARLVREAGPKISYLGACSMAVRCAASSIEAVEARLPGSSAPTEIRVAGNRWESGSYEVEIAGGVMAAKRR